MCVLDNPVAFYFVIVHGMLSMTQLEWACAFFLRVRGSNSHTPIVVLTDKIIIISSLMPYIKS